MVVNFRHMLPILLLVIGIASADSHKFSKSRLTDSTKTKTIPADYSVSEKTRSVFPNNYFFRAVSKGIRWGAVGAIAGASLGMMTNDETRIIPVFFSLLGGASGFIGGSSYGVYNKKSRRKLLHNQPKYYHFGINIEAGGGMAEGQPANDPSFGIVLRWPGKTRGYPNQTIYDCTMDI